MKIKLLISMVLLTAYINCRADQTLISQGSTWRYLDNGSNQGTAWRTSTFSDASWRSGPAQLGYGDGDEATVVNGGPTSNRFITTYFRRAFNITNAAAFTGYTLQIKRDDGVVIYVNGTEVYRNNMPSGTISHTTLASSNAGDDGANFLTATLSASAFVTGTNVIAVEIHQRSASSSDISFDLGLIGTEATAGGTINEVIYQWSGAITPTSAAVVAKLTNASTTCRLVVSTSSTLSNPVYSTNATASSSNNFMAKMNVTGLVPNTTYYYAVESNGATDISSDDIGKFTTPANTAFSYKFTVGSCAVNSNHQAYTLMNNKAPLFHLTTGDFHYDNPNSSTDINVHRRPYENNMLSQTPTRNFFKNTALAFMWDDHDYSGNDSQGSSAGRTNARLAYQEYVPHYTLAAGTGNVPIYQSFTIGRVYFILSDLRSERGGSTMMGSAQKTWFKNQCLFARDNNLIIAWVSSVSFGGNQSDNWGGFTAERTELSNFFRDNNIRNMFILSGDAHMLAIDNGSNHDFSTASNNPNDYPVFQAAAINNSGSTKGGTYSEGGTFPNPNSSTGQYGVVDVTDNGGSDITIKFTGYRTSGNTTTESVLRSYTFTRTLATAAARTRSATGMSLRAVAEGQKVQVLWEKEETLESLIIQRSKDGKTFSDISTVMAANGMFTDEMPENGWNYYCIKNAEGQTLSEKSIFIVRKSSVELFPNPATGIVNIRIKNMPQDITGRYIVYNVNMKTALQGDATLTHGDSHFTLDVSALPSGWYYVHIVVNGVELVEKLLVSK
jgi:phosphodiesterase/alkaline phosphatase D-like protein